MELIIIKNQVEFVKLISNGIRDFSKYKYLGKELFFTQYGVTHLPSKMDNLIDLFCSRNNIETIGNYPNLKRLICDNNPITEIGDCPKLTYLYAYNCKLTSLNDFPLITSISCEANEITSLKNYPLLEELVCCNNKITKLGDYPKLRELHCNDNDIASLGEMPLVEEIHCIGNIITSICDYPLITWFSLFNLKGKLHSIFSPTSDRKVTYMIGLDRVITGCFHGTLKEFYNKGYVEEGKEWVKDFYFDCLLIENN